MAIVYELSLLHIDFETYEPEDVVQSRYDRLEESYLDLCNIWAFIIKWAQRLAVWLLVGIWYGLAYPIKFVVWGGLDLCLTGNYLFSRLRVSIKEGRRVKQRNY